MRAQITLTVAEAKRLIAKGIAKRPEVQEALAHGRILLKGGTTVSAICEELCGKALSVSGRVTPKGTKSSSELEQLWTSALLEGGCPRNITGEFQQATMELTRDDVVILGANAYDHHGNAAMMMGRQWGAGPGSALSGIMGEARNIIIAVGTENLIQGSLNEVIGDTARTAVDFAMGMAVGLMPLCGEIYTELEAIKTLARVHPRIIGKGGIRGAEGATTLIIDGEKNEVQRVFQLARSLKGVGESGAETSLDECKPGKKCKYFCGR